MEKFSKNKIDVLGKKYSTESEDARITSVIGTHEPMSQSPSVGADKNSSVKIEKVFGGYFGNERNIYDFATIGLDRYVDVLKTKDKPMQIADFGGGAGNLAKGVLDFVNTTIGNADILVVDGNTDYLKLASDKGLDSIEADLLSYITPVKCDLIVQRAVEHYIGTCEGKLLMLQNIYKSLNKGGLFVSQLSSGTKENCKLRTEIVTQPRCKLLPNGEVRSHLWIDTDEYISLLVKAGFTDIKIAGYAQGCSWTLTEMWNRFNQRRIDELTKSGDIVTLEQIQARKDSFFRESRAIIEEALKNTDKENLLVESIDNGNDYRISYQYPIITCVK